MKLRVLDGTGSRGPALSNQFVKEQIYLCYGSSGMGMLARGDAHTEYPYWHGDAGTGDAHKGHPYSISKFILAIHEKSSLRPS